MSFIFRYWYFYVFFLLIHSYKIHITAVSTTNKPRSSPSFHNDHPRFSSEELSKQKSKVGTIDLQSKKITKRGRLGAQIKVSIPIGDKVAKRKGKQNPENYWTKEQKIARNANRFVRKGKANDYDEALQMANDKYLKGVEQRRLKRREKKEIRKPVEHQPGHFSKKSWIIRRALGLLEEHDNGIVNREQAFKRADELWKERIEKNRINRKEKRLYLKNQN